MVIENVGDNGDWMIRLREDRQILATVVVSSCYGQTAFSHSSCNTVYRALRDGHRRWGCQGSLACSWCWSAWSQQPEKCLCFLQLVVFFSLFSPLNVRVDSFLQLQRSALKRIKVGTGVFKISVAVLSLTPCSLTVGFPIYRYKRPSKSPITRIFKVKTDAQKHFSPFSN